MKLYAYSIPMLRTFLVPENNRKNADSAIKEFIEKNYKPGVKAGFLKTIPIKAGGVIKIGWVNAV